MKDMTRSNLEAAFAGESQAHMKYLIFAELAEREGLANVARLFRATSFSEQMHATNHLRALGGAGKTSENLKGAFDGETFEIEEMYPAYMAVAEAQGETRATRTMSHAMEAEKTHAALYTKASEAVTAGKDVDLAATFVCDVCGYTVEGEAPERCPLCGATHSHFRQF
ncbi:MAG: rubrerythrin [Chloroflexi bacterium HGW-Chloroflexi-1]|nr:MAG: rubrerythrin [Chloroflexi bacterium HGW-Chloroflexi-1]